MVGDSRSTRWVRAIASRTGTPLLYGPLARFLLVAAVGLVPLVLGYIGLHEYLSRPPASASYGHSWPDILFYDLQLPILAAAPVEGPGPYPVALGIARLLAPAVAGLATLGTLRLLMAEQWRRWSSAASRGHSVVAGDGPVAVELARRLAAEGRRVVLVGAGDEPLAQGHHGNLLKVRGDPGVPATLRAAGIARAEELYACTPEGIANAGIVLRARDEMPGTRKDPLSAYALVRDVGLGVALRARRIGTAADPRLRLDFFDVNDIAARKLLDAHPLAAGRRGMAAAVLVGLGSLSVAILQEIARRHPPVPGGTPVEVVIRNAPDAEVTAIADRFPSVAANCSLSHEQAGHLRASEDCVIFVCLKDADEALREGLDLAHTTPSRVVVCLRESSLAGVLGARGALIDDIMGRLAVFEVNQEACVPADIRADSVERLARAMHGAYVAMEAAKGNTEAANPSMASWERLPEDLRRANIAQAADIGSKMEAIDAVVVPQSPGIPDFTFTDQEVERLSRMEHDRWMRERTARGWAYGEQRDNARKLHPDLRDWSYLSEDARDKDRNAIRTLPDTLREAGFQIVRPPQCRPDRR